VLLGADRGHSRPHLGAVYAAGSSARRGGLEPGDGPAGRRPGWPRGPAVAIGASVTRWAGRPWTTTGR